MLFANNQLKGLPILGVFFACCFSLDIAASDMLKQKEERDTRSLKMMLQSSSQVFVGHFLSEKAGENKFNPDLPVEMKFVIDEEIKRSGSPVESFSIPFPNELFLLGTKKGRDQFKTDLLERKIQLNTKKNSYSEGEISEAEFDAYQAAWKGYFDTNKYKLSFYNRVKKGADMSFNSDVKYVIFLRNPVDSPHVNWEYVISGRTFPLGLGFFADLLLTTETN